MRGRVKGRKEGISVSKQRLKWNRHRQIHHSSWYPAAKPLSQSVNQQEEDEQENGRCPRGESSLTSVKAVYIEKEKEGEEDGES